jgi:hypothetical protein
MDSENLGEKLRMPQFENSEGSNRPGNRDRLQIKSLDLTKL